MKINDPDLRKVYMNQPLTDQDIVSEHCFEDDDFSGFIYRLDKIKSFASVAYQHLFFKDLIIIDHDYIWLSYIDKKEQLLYRVIFNVEHEIVMIQCDLINQILEFTADNVFIELRYLSILFMPDGRYQLQGEPLLVKAFAKKQINSLQRGEEYTRFERVIQRWVKHMPELKKKLYDICEKCDGFTL